MKILGFVYPKPIANACAGVGRAGKIPVFLSLQRMKCSLGVFRCAFFQNKIQLLSFRGPKTKMSLIRSDQFCADRITTLRECHRVRFRLSNRFGNFPFRV